MAGMLPCLFVWMCLQFMVEKCMMKPTVRDLEFDFSFCGQPICTQCLNRTKCKTANIVNVPVAKCTFFSEKTLFPVEFGHEMSQPGTHCSCSTE